MRVIAGSAGGLRLDVPKSDVRPTMDRVKAAIFSSLGEAIIGACVLDLFAGTGALGIEALSRGAAAATFVDDKRMSVAAIESNLAHTKFAGTVRQYDVFEFIRTSRTDKGFDFIFADPPYEKTRSGETFTALLMNDPKLAALLAPGGVFILEKRPDEEIPAAELWTVTRARKYGATEVLFLRHASGTAE
ncbi:MAG: 16S rRNA (guanine(966)-N(2))-methyltransferase RsmD [Verrucomicrobiota bacterium]|nr:16S rRNA (guanine(966)-N(2))-methyltransferase RsmD [Verrucomicrobiota bacterium]